MALKKKLTKEEHAKLSDALKAEYIEDGDGFRLDVDGDEDTGALKRAKDREAQLRKDAEKEAKELRERLESIEGDDARKKGDIATLEKSWQSKLEKQREEYEAKVSKLTSHTTKTLVDNVALSIATKISNAPAIILPHIRARLQADFEGDTPVTRVLDKDGKPSALTIDELANEFVANKDFSAIITASKASGGAGKPSQNGGGAPKFNGQSDKPADLSKMNPAELAAHLKEAKANETKDA
ncbi:putative scaffold protein [Pseudomonas phage Kaya]|uniref:Scaffold protein n=1 Tax=Pseudomonas phage Kaya TaxID=2872675 RepID=A0AAE8XBU3_9CAUD|nr:head scaffolding protein [Pseudomonas phage Kaya]UAG58588.1 putative scaffold protein [Pseudomonas phage Kaya]